MLPIHALNAVCDRGYPTHIESIVFSPALRILVLAPHPDDFDAIAITLRYFQERGNEIHLAVLSGGSLGVLDSYANPPTSEHKARLREKEQEKSCRFFGLAPERLCFLRLPDGEDGELAHNPANQEHLSRQISKTTPDILFLPYGDDINSGHRRTYNMVRTAVRKLGKPLLALYNKDVKTLNFRCELYFSYDETQAEWKRALLRFHNSQQTRNIQTRGHGFDDRILSFNQKLAQDLTSELPYAEAFQLELFNSNQQQP